MAGTVGTNILTQVGFIVEDIEATKQKFAEFLGLPVPPHFDGGKFEVTQTQVKGKPAPEANCLMAFFDVGANLQIELIQPNETPSVWRDFLNEKGEGIHHLAFGVRGMDKMILNCENFGMTCVQRGKYGDGGGEYAYLDAYKDLKCLVELLESY
ncbi:MAG: VOC family protein [Oscillospiraceae bacterium]|nr:VOC family protein [Oscillospiraceae bacterium]